MYIEFKGRRGRELYDIREDPRQLDDLIHTEEGQRIAGELKRILGDLKKGKVSSSRPIPQKTAHP
jgi:hypothetical protein